MGLFDSIKSTLGIGATGSMVSSPPAGLPSASPDGDTLPDGVQAEPIEWMSEKDSRKWNAVITSAVEQFKRDADLAKYYTNLFKFGEFKNDRGASANYTFADVSLLMSTLYYQDPTISVIPHNEGDIGRFSSLVGPPGSGAPFNDLAGAQKYYAETLEKILKHTWVEARSSFALNAVLFEAIVVGMGVTKVGWDDYGYDRIDTLHRYEIFFDPNARYDINQSTYAVQCCTYHISEARAFFTKIGAPDADKLDGNYELKEEESLSGEMANKNEPDTGHKAYFRFYEIWHKKPNGDRKIYYRHFEKEEWIFVRDWPYTLDDEGFPFCKLSFNDQFVQVQDAFSDLFATNGLRKTHENIVEFYRRHVMKGIATKWLYDESVIDPDKKQDLLSEEDMKFVGITGLSQMKQPPVMKLNFTEDAKVYMELATVMKQAKDQISGIADIERGNTPSQTTATAASLEDKWGKQRINKKQKTVDEFIAEICRKRSMIALQLMSPEKVEAIAGKLAALVWQTYSGDIKDLQCEYSIDILAGSTAEDYRNKRLQDLQITFKLGSGLNTQQPFPVVDTVKIFKDILELQNVPHPEKYIIGPLLSPDAGLPPAPPSQLPGKPPSPPPGFMPPQPPPGMPPPGGPPHPTQPPGPGSPPQAQGPNGIGPGGHPPMPVLPGERPVPHGPGGSPMPYFKGPVHPNSLAQGLRN